MELHNIPYAPDSASNKYLQFDLYLPAKAPSPAAAAPPLICFVHGGAWRSEDKADHADLARKLVALTDFCVAVPNYRLTSKDPLNLNYHLQHPAHAEDIYQFLTFMLAWEGPNDISHQTSIYDPQRISLIGHSCSAHMLASIFLDSSSTTPSLTPPSALRQAVRDIVVSEGIYDLDLLLSKFPGYREWFIEDAFGREYSFAAFSANRFPLWDSDSGTRWLVIHSKGDSLVDLSQSETMYAHLCELYKAAGIPSESRVFRNTDALIENHNDILRSNEYVDIVGQFILDIPSHAT